MINAENVENFMKSLGLKLPFNKLEIEKFINERRGMSAKNLLDIQTKKRKDNLNELRNNENNNSIYVKKKEEETYQMNGDENEYENQI